MSRDLPPLWPAEPHTIAKIAILKGYLNVWFRVLGKSRPNETITYVDGFAGPGRYRNDEEGSPVAALRAAVSAIHALAGGLQAKEFHCVFIERERRRFDLLTSAIAPFENIAKLRVTKLNLEFTAGIKEVARNLPNFGDEPTFVFADPFGGTGIPLETFRRCMRGNTAELLINLDVDGIARIFAASTNRRRNEQLTEIFGTDLWRQKLTVGAELKKQSVEILDLYKDRLRSFAGVRFVWPFAMRGKHDALNYCLVFATKHRLGMEKMKESMRAIDQTGAYTFSDAHREQQVLFREDNAEQYAGVLFTAFKNKTISMEHAHDFALSETPFTNAKGMLALLERQGKLQVRATAGQARRKYSFPEEKIAALRFSQSRTRHSQTEFF